MRYIDADALIAEYDRVHVGAPGEARKLMVDAPTADVTPKSEVAREIFEEIEREIKNHGICYAQRKIAELKKKYTEAENDR